MSEENVALVRRNYEVINSVDRSGEKFIDPEAAAPDLWAGLAPDFEISGRSDVPDARTYRGREESKEFWRMLQEIFTELRWEPLHPATLRSREQARSDRGHRFPEERRWLTSRTVKS